MVAFGWGTGRITGHGDIKFNESITLYDLDGSVSIRQMNPSGGFYDAVEELYEDDDNVSLHLSDVEDDDDDGFLDALQEQLQDDNEADGALLMGDDNNDDDEHDYFEGSK